MAVDPPSMTAVVLLYIAITFILGYLGHRQTKKAEDYLVAGRSTHPVIIALATAMFMGLCAAAFLPSFAYGVYSKNPLKKAALTSSIVGAVVWLIWAAFVNIRVSNPFKWAKDSPTLCQAVFGKASLLPLPWSSIDPIVIGLPLSALVVGIMVIANRTKT